MEKINFYKTADPYGDFSNFSKHPITAKDKVWPTTEHYFQAQKFTGTEHEESVRLCKGPRAAAAMGRDRNLPLRKDWEQVKEDIMEDALWAKIQQYPDILKLLLSTRGCEIIEHTENDNYWADGGDGSGKNRLGVIWMKIRDRIIDEYEMGLPHKTTDKEIEEIKEMIKDFFKDNCKHETTKVMNYNVMWKDGDVVCSNCGKLIRTFDAG